MQILGTSVRTKQLKAVHTVADSFKHLVNHLLQTIVYVKMGNSKAKTKPNTETETSSV
jgi:hypothetical protein